MDTIPQDAPLKQCTKCKKWLPATSKHFHVGKRNKYGFKNQCIFCRSEEWALKHPKPAIATTRECTKCFKTLPFTFKYFSVQKNGKNGLRSICRVCCKAYDHLRNANPSEQKKAARKETREKHKDYQSEYDRNRRITHGDILKQRKKAYYDIHPEQRRVEAHRRRTRERVSGEKYTRADVEQQYKNQKGKCYYCKTSVGKIYDVDHVIPISRGGANDKSNIVIACRACNRSKQNKLPHEWPQGNRLL